MSIHPIVGAMPPNLFLETFMNIGDGVPEAPKAEFASVVQGDSVLDMAELFVSVHVHVQYYF